MGKVNFPNGLLKLGNGTIPIKEEDPFKGCIEIPNQCIIRENESIVEKIFGDADQNDYSKRVILTPTNVDSLSINEEVLECLPGEVKIYLSADQIDTDDLNERNNFPVEFLNSLTPSGMPPQCLKLKIGCVIMLLRNLDLKAGLCNGTRMKVCALQNNYIDAEVLTGVSSGKRVFVPRIQLAPSDSNLPFVLKRRQFPVRLAYSMTINKSQRQTFAKYLKQVNTPQDLLHRLECEYKEGKGFRYFACNFVKEIFWTGITENSAYCFVKCKVTPSQRTSSSLYYVWAAIKKELPGGEIASAYCSCTAGLLGSCKHVAAILFRIEAAVSNGVTKPTCF